MTWPADKQLIPGFPFGPMTCSLRATTFFFSLFLNDDSGIVLNHTPRLLDASTGCFGELCLSVSQPFSLVKEIKLISHFHL